ncbi:hypothetical protein BOTBODRAFT_187311 [Botryobasidium botryosum FD-172 SS1]|uniref:XRRM domain-containing protein n=1 Tax=Botryobasidium botryosum (strain FD-172 SS1) TaxID=930990 RepID=A0A067ML91_BOTB1|nr:hypothetical protein BOTBODRAFT_187311 [Botryobasidium botryosum FD-172 SS1]
MSFNFIPRALKTKNGKAAAASSSSVPPNPTPIFTQRPPPVEGPRLTPNTKGKGKEKELSRIAKDEELERDLATLLELSFSDYAFWSAHGLRQAVSTSKDGFVPLRRLLNESVFSAHIPQPRPSESAFAKALKAHGSGFLEVRILFTEPSQGDWNDPDAQMESEQGEDAGGYEIRRKDWHSIKDAHPLWGTAWEGRTIYVENMPPSARSLPSLARFMHALLPPPSPSQSPVPMAVQSITFPNRQSASEGSNLSLGFGEIKCRGFAFVTFREVEHAERAVQEWPWDTQEASEGNTATPSNTTAVEAKKCGFRTMSKGTWVALKEEYLAYQAHLLDLSKPTASPDPEPVRSSQPIPNSNQPPPLIHHTPVFEHELETYPRGCLVFVRNVHPETNKTTLKALFSAAFAEESSGVDYVDFQKGIDSCHLRLSTPAHATRLWSYLDSRPIIQASALDGEGRVASGDERPIIAEIVDGKREELYWERVPEKVRRESVLKARIGAGGHDAGGAGNEPEGGSGPRKRRRKRG